MNTKLKRLACAGLCLALLLLTACGSAKTEYSGNVTVVVPEEESAAPVQTPAPEKSCDFSELTGLEFYFASGAGGWSTVMYINEDGSLEGYYHDSEMGSVGEGYPNGSFYECSFKGVLGGYEELDEHSFALTASELSYAVPGEERIIDGVKYITAEPYGISEGCRLVFYRAGTPVEGFSEETLMWLCLPEGTKVLDYPAIYNSGEGYAFSSYPINAAAEISGIYAELEDVENTVAPIELSLHNDSLSQREMNELSDEIFRLWNNELNLIWQRLKESLDAESMKRLTTEELEWIALKEQKCADEAAAFEGGSMYPLIYNSTAAELTRARVYELAEYLK